MVKKSLKDAIGVKLAELCEKHGVSANLEVVDFFDDDCVVVIPKDVSNLRHDAVTAVCEDLKNAEGVKSIWDKGRGSVLRGEETREFQIKVKTGFWEHTKEDDERMEFEMRKYFDPKCAEEEAKRKEAVRRKHWKEYIIPIPKMNEEGTTELYLTMAYEPFDLIKSGEKVTEFRAYTERYAKRILGNPIKTVKFQRGYGGPGRGKPEQMVFDVSSITLYDSHNKIECDPHNPTEGIIPTFFAINLGKRLS